MSERVNILLIEDNPGDARLVEIYLQSAIGFEFTLTHAVRLSEGIGLSKNNPIFDVILLDLSLPDSQGFQTLKTATAAFPKQSSIIVLTGLNDESLGIKAVESGAQDYLVKDQIDTTLLTRSILHAISRRKMQLEVETTATNLKLSEERLLLAQRIALIGNYEYHPQENYMFASGEVYSILEVPASPTDFTPNHFYEILNTPAHQKSAKELYREILKSRQTSFDFEHRLFIKKDNRYKYIRNKGQIEYSPETGNVIKVIGAIQDITAFKYAEEMLMQSQERYKIVFEESQDAIYMTTQSGEFVEFNQSLLSLLGYSRKELYNIHFDKIFAQPEQLKEFYTRLTLHKKVKDFEVELQCRNGQIIDCTITTKEWKSIEGDIMGFHGIIRDITLLKRNQELIKAKEIAEQTAHHKEQFLANMSHEIRSPMNVVVGMAHLIESTNLNPKQAEYVNALKLSSDNLLRLINNILDFSKIEAHKIEIEKRPFNLHHLINDLISTSQFEAKEKNIDLYSVISETLPEIVVGDSVRLYQILNNLLSNALKFTHQGKVVLSARVKQSSAVLQELTFSVEDTGIGIPYDKQQTIFDSFTQAADSTARLYGGTGLGLTIAKSLVELMGGELSVQSEPEKGAVFSFDIFFETAINANIIEPEPPLFPLVSSKENQHQDIVKSGIFAGNIPHDNLETFDSTLSPDSQVNILLVEDQRLNQIVASDLLKKWSEHLNIEIANNGKEAIEMVVEKGSFYHLILMDLSMPVMDGFQATRFIREQLSEPVCNIPVIAMTAHAYNTNAQRCYEAGMNEFITKPIKPELLYKSIGKVLGLSERQTNLQEQNTTDKTSGLNLDYLRSLAGNDNEILIVMIETLIDELPDELETLINSKKTGDWEVLKRTAHKFKSTCAYMGMEDMVEIARNIENLLWKEESSEFLDNWVATLNEQCRKAYLELKLTLKLLKSEHQLTN